MVYLGVMKRTQGFTVIELLVVVVLFALAGLVFLVQKNNLEIASRDKERKADINALYYALEEVYYKDNQSYPSVLSTETLRGIDSGALTDPAGVGLSEEKTIAGVPTRSTYRYEPTDCTDGLCSGYTLRAILENEAEFVKTSRGKS